MMKRSFGVTSLAVMFVVAGLCVFLRSANSTATAPTVTAPAPSTAATDKKITIRSSAITAGGVKSSGGDFVAASTLGQPAVGAMSGGKFAMSGGFSPAPAFLSGDCDADGDVDRLDYQLFESCLLGPNQPDVSGCGCFDLEVSDTVDLADFAKLANAFTSG